MESYRTVRAGEEAVGEVVDRKSRFIAQLVHVESEEDAAEHIAAVRSCHFDARHNVPAWILADGRDDGEPQRTSGMPSLEVLRGANLRDVCCVTTRYFGGTLLGPGGLVRAYGAAVQAAIDAALEAGKLVEMTSVVSVVVTVAYSQYEQVLHMVEQAGGKVSDTAYTDEVALSIVFKAGDEQPFLTALRERLAGRERVEVSGPRFDEF